MTSKCPKNLKFGLGEIYNTSPVHFDHWKALDEHLAYLATARHLQQPVMIGHPMNYELDEGSQTGVSPALGYMRFKWRIPAYSRFLRVHLYAYHYEVYGATSVNHFVQVKLVQAGATGSNIYTKVEIGNGGENGDDNDAAWYSTPMIAVNDSPVADTAFPMTPYWDSQEDEIVVYLDIPPSVAVFACWFQSDVEPDATLDG